MEKSSLLHRGVSVVSVGAELFFANIGPFRDAVMTEIESRTPRAVVLDTEAVSDVDTTAADEIVTLHRELEARGIHLLLARLTPSARSSLVAAGLDIEGIDYAHVAEAVARYSA
jgi:SulP family sulfate permease